MESKSSVFFSCPQDVSGDVLVVPLLSIGNVAQLSVDLLVNSFRLQRVGTFADPSIEAMASCNVFAQSGELSFAAELFQSLDRRVALLQLRSKLSEGHIGRFCRKLLTWLTPRFKEVVVLGSFDAVWLRHPDVELHSFRFVSANAENSKNKESSTAKSVEILQRELSLQPLEEETIDYLIPARTFPQLLFANLNAASVPFVALFMFCAEGNNVFESQLMTGLLVRFLHARGYHFGSEDQGPNVNMVAPISWQGLIQSSSPEELASIRQLFQ